MATSVFDIYMGMAEQVKDDKISYTEYKGIVTAILTLAQVIKDKELVTDKSFFEQLFGKF